MKGNLYLIPVTLGSTEFDFVIPEGVQKKIKALRYFIVEDIRSARRFLRLIDKTFPIDDSNFSILNEHTDKNELSELVSDLLQGFDVGLMSEAGLPAIADPGAQVVGLARRYNINVIPLTGPSSIYLALMASGFNGQLFTFNGYLPVKGPQRSATIRNLAAMGSKGHTQIFMETPYRNLSLFKEILSVCNDDVLLSISHSLTTENEYSNTLTIKRWKKEMPDLKNKPAIFIFGRFIV